jgi:GTP cyclohydrolase I
MARNSLEPGARHDPATNGRGTFPVTAREKPRKRVIRGGEDALLERIGERPRRSRARDTPGRVLSARQRWF